MRRGAAGRSQPNGAPGDPWPPRSEGWSSGFEDPDLSAEPLTGAAPTVDLLRGLLRTAMTERASDVHIEPHPPWCYVRFRTDGVMRDHMRLPLEGHAPLVSRVKILARLDIAERRLPQDGHFTEDVGGPVVDVRVSTIPTTSGEKVVMRLLPKEQGLLRLDELGFDGPKLPLLENLFAHPHGMVLVTGPTGSGKTTTLYAALAGINDLERNIVTIEDPVEYELARISQIQTHAKIGLTFASGLRHILRQDPDIIMVGEIRDGETLQMAVQAALTGHLVLSTLHCNDAASAASRLLDLGVEPFLLASCLVGIVAQRLVRRLCVSCHEQTQPPPELWQALGLEPGNQPYYTGRGCAVCRDSGYYGRVGVCEVMPMTDAVRRAILRRQPAAAIREIAQREGVESLRADGLRKAGAGLTSLAEVLRATYVRE